jgi:hypothetical protein
MIPIGCRINQSCCMDDACICMHVECVLWRKNKFCMCVDACVRVCFVVRRMPHYKQLGDFLFVCFHRHYSLNNQQHHTNPFTCLVWNVINWLSNTATCDCLVWWFHRCCNTFCAMPDYLQQPTFVHTNCHHLYGCRMVWLLTRFVYNNVRARQTFFCWHTVATSTACLFRICYQTHQHNVHTIRKCNKNMCVKTCHEHNKRETVCVFDMYTA